MKASDFPLDASFSVRYNTLTFEFGNLMETLKKFFKEIVTVLRG